MSEPTVFAPRGPELGLLQRSRDWVDVLPWLRLTRVLRLAGSPIWLASVAAVWWLWSWGCAWILGSDFRDNLQQMPWLSFYHPGDLWIPLPSFWIGLDENRSLVWSEVRGWAFVTWTLFCWTPIAMVLARLGGWLTAGREIQGFGSTIRLILPRIVSGWIAAIMPVVCAAPALLVIALVDYLVDAKGPSEWTAWLGPVLGLVSLAASVLIVAGKFAVPLAWASLAIEPQPDPLDCLSRGFEYVLRRAPQTALLILVAAVQIVFVSALWLLVAVGAERLCENVVPESPGWAVGMLRTVGLTLGWGMIGGIYLLLRQTAGGQEVEDIR